MMGAHHRGMGTRRQAVAVFPGAVAAVPAVPHERKSRPESKDSVFFNWDSNSFFPKNRSCKVPWRQKV
jgi:hypothetical protein